MADYSTTDNKYKKVSVVHKYGNLYEIWHRGEFLAEFETNAVEDSKEFVDELNAVVAEIF